MEGVLKKNPSKNNLKVLYSDIFNSQFPYYLSIGMSSEQYWDDDCELVKAYRKAEEIKTDKKNQELWLQGMYIYDAILRVSPILRPFAEQGTEPIPYLEEPYQINNKENEEKRKNKEEKYEYEKMKQYIEMYSVSNNLRFKNKEKGAK